MRRIIYITRDDGAKNEYIVNYNDLQRLFDCLCVEMETEFIHKINIEWGVYY